MGLENFINKRVMIVDDLANMRTDLSKILKSLGFTNLKEAVDGVAALTELKTEADKGTPYDIIFSDVNMPNMNGIELLKALRLIEGYKRCPIFIVSTVNEKHIIVKAIIEGATDYILKPYDPILVIEKLNSRLK